MRTTCYFKWSNAFVPWRSRMMMLSKAETAWSCAISQTWSLNPYKNVHVIFTPKKMIVLLISMSLAFTSSCSSSQLFIILWAKSSFLLYNVTKMPLTYGFAHRHHSSLRIQYEIFSCFCYFYLFMFPCLYNQKTPTNIKPIPKITQNRTISEHRIAFYIVVLTKPSVLDWVMR